MPKIRDFDESVYVPYQEAVELVTQTDSVSEMTSVRGRVNRFSINASEEMAARVENLQAQPNPGNLIDASNTLRQEDARAYNSREFNQPR